MRDERVLVSACLLGLRCRYDGRALEPCRLPEGICPVPVCPEQLGGLPTPRPPSRLYGGDGRAVLEGRARVVAEGGEDVTEAFLRGAQEAVKLAQAVGAKRAFLKERSPSCGVRWIWLADELVEGKGVAAAALEKAGIEIVSSEVLK